MATIHQPAWIAEFKAFLMRGNVMDLAVAVVVGAAFTGIVTSLVTNIINPVIGIATGGVDLSGHFITLKGKHEPTLTAAKAAGAVTLNYGAFLNALIYFFIVAFVVFWMVRLISKLYKPTPSAPPAPPRAEVLLEEIRDLLKAREIR
ncbi:MAG TPA: large conductance mechanosensitive channel protein MscL [Acetobacteraceae bacterium]|nr:large conductance mechanosensitive channel protein MscL [Acetobacteraceae bacterium]